MRGCVEKCMQFADRERLFLSYIYASVYVTKQPGDKAGYPCFYTTIIDAAQHTHIGRNCVWLQPMFVEVLSVSSQTIASDLPESYAGSTTEPCE